MAQRVQAQFTGGWRKTQGGEWGAVIDRKQTDRFEIPEDKLGLPEGGLLGSTVQVTSKNGKTEVKRIKSVDDVSDRYVRVVVEDCPQLEPGDAREPGDEERSVTEANLAKWFRAVMAEMRKAGADVEPVKAAMKAVKVKWEAR